MTPTCGPHMSTAEGRRGGRRRLGRLGPVWPHAGREDVGPKTAQRLRKGFLKPFSIKIIREMMFHLLKILPLLK